MLKAALSCLLFPFKTAKKIADYENEIVSLQHRINRADFDYFDLRERALYWQERALHKKHTVNPQRKEVL